VSFENPDWVYPKESILLKIAVVTAMPSCWRQ
jgi:hypothetical protein